MCGGRAGVIPSALVCARMCSCSLGARIAGVVCACMCVPACSRKPREMGTDAAPCSRAGYISAVFDACAHENYNFYFLKLTGSYSRDGHRVQHRNT